MPAAVVPLKPEAVPSLAAAEVPGAPRVAPAVPGGLRPWLVCKAFWNPSSYSRSCVCNGAATSSIPNPSYGSSASSAFLGLAPLEMLDNNIVPSTLNDSFLKSSSSPKNQIKSHQLISHLPSLKKSVKSESVRDNLGNPVKCHIRPQ